VAALTAEPPRDGQGRCVSCGMHWNLCGFCGLWWAGTHVCERDADGEIIRKVPR
jgi:hypothetical protein